MALPHRRHPQYKKNPNLSIKPGMINHSKQHGRSLRKKRSDLRYQVHSTCLNLSKGVAIMTATAVGMDIHEDIA